MAHAHDTPISAADFNSLATAAAYVYGVGNGDHGYGQSSPALPTLSSDTANPASAWTALRGVLENCYMWQNTVATLLPPSIQNSSDNAHVAYAAGDPKSWADMTALLDTNRLNYQFGNMALASSAASTTRGTTWDSFIQAGFSIDYDSENAARYFFNTGGELRIAFAHPSTASSQDTDWHNMLDNLNIAFRAHSTAKLTGNGTGSSIGYYELTTSWQAVYTVNGTGAYSANSLVVYARADSITGLNGAKGSLIYLYCNFNESHTNAFYDVAQSGTVATLGRLRCAGSPLPSAIPAPTCAVVVAL